MAFPLSSATPSSLGFDVRALERLQELITRHLAEGRYPAAQIAVAREGKLALVRSFGDARLDPARVPAREDSLWLLYSNTKVITACAVWILAEQGALRFTDRVADHVPGFEANGKGDITIVQLLSHQGGFPNADVPKAAWEDHELLRRTVSAFTLEWTPGSRVHYHGRAAHWVAAVLIEALSKTDYRAFIREQVVEPLGLGDELFVGLPDAHHDRAVDMHEPAATGVGQGNRGQVRRDDTGKTLLGDAQEAVGMGGGPHRVDRDLHPAVGAILEPHRHRQARRQLTVNLAFRGARADGAPAHEVGDELGGDRVEELAARGQPELSEIEEKPPAPPEANVDRIASIQIGVVDEALPPDRRTRLLEIHAHDEPEVPPNSSESRRRRRAYSRPAAGSWIEHGPTTMSSRSPWPFNIRDISSRARVTVRAPASLRGSSSSRRAGGVRARMLSMRRSRIFIARIVNRSGSAGVHPKSDISFRAKVTIDEPVGS